MNLVFGFVMLIGLQFSADQNLEFWWKQLEANSLDIRINSLQKLAEIRDPRSIPYISRGLADPDARVRYYAAIALGRHNDQASMDALSNRLVQEADVYVKGEIRRNINQLKDYFSKQEAESPAQE